MTHPCYPGTSQPILLGGWVTGITDDDEQAVRTGRVITIGWDIADAVVVTIETEHGETYDLDGSTLEAALTGGEAS